MKQIYVVWPERTVTQHGFSCTASHVCTLLHVMCWRFLLLSRAHSLSISLLLSFQSTILDFFLNRFFFLAFKVNKPTNWKTRGMPMTMGMRIGMGMNGNRRMRNELCEM